LWQELRKLGVVIHKPSRTFIKHRTKEKPRESLERQLLECLLQRPDLISQATSQLNYKDFSNENYSRIAEMLFKSSGNGTNIRVPDLIDDCNDEKLRSIISSLFLHRDIPKVEVTLNGCIKKLKNSIMREDEHSRIAAGNGEGDDLILLKELMELSTRRKTELK